MPRNDPTDNGGLFIGRRPGTGPVRYRKLPEGGSPFRQRLDRIFAVCLMLSMGVVVASFWGPMPLAGLWVGSQAEGLSGSPMLGILVAFVFCLLYILLGIVLLTRMDRWWILVRRAGGCDQKTGVLSHLFVISSLIGVSVFSVWLLLFSGAELAPVGIRF